MGLFGGKKQVSPAVDSLLSMDDKAIDKLLKQHKGTPFKTAKDIRKATADGRRPIEGEKGMGALLAGLKGGGTGGKNYRNQPVENRVHPSQHRKALTDEIMRAVKSGDRAAQVRLRDEAKKHGYL